MKRLFLGSIVLLIVLGTGYWSWLRTTVRPKALVAIGPVDFEHREVKEAIQQGVEIARSEGAGEHGLDQLIIGGMAVNGSMIVPYWFRGDFLGNPASHPNGFGTWVDLDRDIQLFIERVSILKPAKVSILPGYDGKVHAVVNDKLVLGLKAAGVEDVEVETVNAKDAELVANKVAAFQPNLIIAIAESPTLRILVPALREYRTSAGAELLTNFAIMDAAKDLSPQDLEGIRLVAPKFLTANASPELIRLWQRVSLQYGTEGTYAHAYGYAIAKWLAQAAAEGAFDDPKTTSEKLRTIEAVIFGGKFRFDEQGTLDIPLEVGGFLGGKLRHLHE